MTEKNVLDAKRIYGMVTNIDDNVGKLVSKLKELNIDQNTILIFINDFIMPQVKILCKNMGFRKYPTVRFQEVDIKDEVQFQRVITRLLEIGIITPEQGMNAIRTGLFPHAEELEQAQEKYIEA